MEKIQRLVHRYERWLKIYRAFFISACFMIVSRRFCSCLQKQSTKGVMQRPSERARLTGHFPPRESKFAITSLLVSLSVY